MTVNVAVVGATGNVGTTVLSILDERKFPISNIYALASCNSLGKQLPFSRSLLNVTSLETFDFSKVDIAIFSAGSAISSKYVPIATNARCTCIDNTSHFRMYSDVPLVVPEINFHSIGDAKIISNPNCVVVPLVIVLDQLQKLAPIKRVVVSTYQSVSGAGKTGIDELYEQTYNKLMKPKKFLKQIAFNAIACIDTIEDNGFTKEENKIRNEVRKILNNNTIELVATCVRVPVFVGHSISANIEFDSHVEMHDAIKILESATSISIVDHPTPVECAGTDQVYVSRIRQDPSVQHGLCMWIVSDNVRKGAALNAVQIAEKILEHGKLFLTTM